MTYSVGRGDLHHSGYLGPRQSSRSAWTWVQRPLSSGASSPVAETLSVPHPFPVQPQVFNVEMPRTRGRWGRHFLNSLHWLGELSRLCDAILQRAWQF